MRRNLLYLFITILSAYYLSACSSENDEASNSTIIGKWQLISVSPSNMATDYDDCEFEGYISFDEDGKYYDHRPCGVNDIGGGRWKLSNNELTIISDIFPVPLEATIELSEDRLVIIQEAIDFDDDYNVISVKLRETYKRVN